MALDYAQPIHDGQTTTTQRLSVTANARSRQAKVSTYWTPNFSVVTFIVSREADAMGVELWLVRHGETEWSLSGAHTSRTDIALTAHGRTRAEELRPFLAKQRFARVLTSPMQRARETCEIAGLGGQAVVDEGLREWDYGESEGKTTKEMRAKYDDPEWSVWTREIVDGERVEHVGERADGVIARACEGLADKDRVVLFAHAHILRILAARWIGLEATGGKLLALGTGSVSVLDWERETRVIARWNREFEE